MNEFTLPCAQKVIRWRPLKVQESLDLNAAHTRDADKPLLGILLMMRRIVEYDGKQGSPTQKDWGEWDEEDLDAFAAEVRDKEDARRRAYAKAQAGPDPNARLKAAVSDMQEVLSRMGGILTEVMEAAENAKRPLG